MSANYAMSGVRRPSETSRLNIYPSIAKVTCSAVIHRKIIVHVHLFNFVQLTPCVLTVASGFIRPKWPFAARQNTSVNIVSRVSLCVCVWELSSVMTLYQLECVRTSNHQCHLAQHLMNIIGFIDKTNNTNNITFCLRNKNSRFWWMKSNQVWWNFLSF